MALVSAPPADPRKMGWARRGATLAVATLALALIGTMSWGDVLTARGRVAQAAALPGNSSIAGVALINASGRTIPPPTVVANAKAALRNSPVKGEALTVLALDARAHGNDVAAIRLLDLSGRMGWHDENGRRQLFNLAAARGDGANALYHADALLRQGLARDELYASLSAASADPAFRKALSLYVTRAEGWPQDWLATRGSTLSDAALLDLLTARARSAQGLDRATAGPILVGLMQSGRLGNAVQVWRLVRGADGFDAGALDWDRGYGQAMLTPFDWSISPGLTIDGSAEAALVAPRTGEAVIARRLLALEPGRYRLAFPNHAPAGWRWTFACGASGPVPSETLGPGATLIVPAGCPVQYLAFAPSTIAAAIPDPLPVPRLARQN